MSQYPRVGYGASLGEFGRKCLVDSKIVWVLSGGSQYITVMSFVISRCYVGKSADRVHYSVIFRISLGGRGGGGRKFPLPNFMGG